MNESIINEINMAMGEDNLETHWNISDSLRKHSQYII